MIEELDSSLFDWQKWRARNLGEILEGYKLRTYNLKFIRDKIKRAAVGYCFGENLNCRPKENHIALMCFHNNEHFWFHLRKSEFYEIFSI